MLFFISVISSLYLYSSEPEIPNKKEFEEITLMTSMASAEDDSEMARIIAERSLSNGDMCSIENKKQAGPFLKDIKTMTPPSLEVKKSPKVTFYSRFTAPVEEMKFYDVNKSWDLSDLKNVVTAQTEGDRNFAIKTLCEGKSNIDKIQYASSLFEKLADVYNDDMTKGSGHDPYSDIDKTKNSDEKLKITIQRQYNVLNKIYFDGDENYPDKAGVCRHAAILVSDFLDKCGLKVEPIAYATIGSGHAVVKAIDPKTKKTYFLNWGELKEAQRSEALSSFDIESDTIPGMGMIVRHYSPQGDGIRGYTRTNKGVVIARLLQAADNDFDVTTFGTNELGAAVELRKFRAKNSKNGSVKEVVEKLTINSITAEGPVGDYQGYSSFDGFSIKRTPNTGIQNPGGVFGVYGGIGFSMIPLEKRENIEGVSVGYESQKTIKDSKNNYFSNKLEINSGIFRVNEEIKIVHNQETVNSSQTGFGAAFSFDAKVGKVIEKSDSKTTLEVGVKPVAEIYYLSSLDGSLHIVPQFKVKSETPKNYVELDASVRKNADLELSANDGVKIITGYSNPKINLIFAENKSNKQTVGVSASYVGSIERESTTLEAFYKNNKHKTSASGGFIVVKSEDGRSDTYAVIKTGKDVNWGSGEVRTNIEARKAVTNSNPAAIQATISIKK